MRPRYKRGRDGAANIEKLGRHAEVFKKKQAVPKSFERVGKK